MPGGVGISVSCSDAECSEKINSIARANTQRRKGAKKNHYYL
jgi:hypothetical protein